MPERLSTEAAIRWLVAGETAELMARADEERHRRHGGRTYFTHSLNLNPTNVCENQCELCAFWRAPDAADAYRIELDQARTRLREAQAWGLTDLHIVGGVHRDLGLDYYERLIRLARAELPETLVQGLTAVEIHYLAQHEGLDQDTVLRRLRDAGLGAVPGGGAEIFNPSVRERICSKKISADAWLTVHARAHALGLPSNATMLFGHLETPEDIVDHLDRLRRQQDQSGGFQAFIALPFHPQGTRLAGVRGPSGQVIVRTVALARLFLDNIPHIRVLANYLDRKLLHVLLGGGADDIGGTSLEERIARAAGAPTDHGFGSPRDMEAMVTALGLDPVLVNSVYRPARHAVVAPVCATPAPRHAHSDEWQQALADAEAGRRLTDEQAILLHDAAPWQRLGVLAHRRRLQVVPGRNATFVIDRNISVTNVCETGCAFCAFHVTPGAPEAFLLTPDEIVAKVAEASARGATQVLLQGGVNPQANLAYYEEVFRRIKAGAKVWLHSLSPTEVDYLARQAGLSIAATLDRLRAAGLDSLPGGGAEILVDAVRAKVSPRKLTADAWFEVMETAQRLGMSTTATMVYGLGETTAQRVEHLLRVRALQDRTQGFLAFIPWSYQSPHTRWPRPPSTGVDYLRLVALARLVLDNVPHVQAGWVTEGPDLAQLALSFGADDFGGVLMEERVVRATGVAYAVTPEEIVALIRAAGLTPVQRTTRYEPLRIHAAADAVGSGKAVVQ